MKIEYEIKELREEISRKNYLVDCLNQELKVFFQGVVKSELFLRKQETN